MPSIRNRDELRQSSERSDGVTEDDSQCPFAASVVATDARCGRPTSWGIRPPDGKHRPHVAFLDYAEQYYVQNGRETDEIDCFRSLIRVLRESFDLLAVEEFGPNELRALRHQMIEKGWARGFINRQVNRLRHMVKWGVDRAIHPVWLARRGGRGADAAVAIAQGPCSLGEHHRWRAGDRQHPSMLTQKRQRFRPPDFDMDHDCLVDDRQPNTLDLIDEFLPDHRPVGVWVPVIPSACLHSTESE
jgi:hypothetical protein